MRWTPWLGRFPLAVGSRKKSPVIREARPRLETLEDRVAPAAFPTATSISAGAATFGLFNQMETVTTQTNFVAGGGLNGPASTPAQMISITDGGQTQTVPINASGQATATFTFNLFQELGTFGAHGISASYPGIPAGTDVSLQTVGSSSANGTAPGNVLGFYFQLYFDLLLFQSFTGQSASSGMGSGGSGMGGSSSSGG